MISLLKNRIDKEPSRTINYAVFMELALYDPTYGYYQRDTVKIGRQGDFITSSNMADIYGRTMAKWFLNKTREYNLPTTICELGAGNGRFAASFIDQWRRLSDEHLTYILVEGSKYHRKVQSELFQWSEHIQQFQRIEDVPHFEGIIFSNELFDALPVHVIQQEKGELMEVMISYEHDELFEVLMPLENKEIIEFLEENQFVLTEGQRLEIPLAMKDMIRKISDTLVRGIVCTVDYGYTKEEWMNPIHHDGSLRGYRRHECVHDVLNSPGEMDITAHVHFDSLISIGEQYGLTCLKKQRQDEFLLSNGVLDELQEHSDRDPFSNVHKRNRAIKSLVLPSGISSYFHVILQEK